MYFRIYCFIFIQPTGKDSQHYIYLFIIVKNYAAKNTVSNTYISNFNIISTLIISVSCPLDKFSRSPILDTFNDSMPGESQLKCKFKEVERVMYSKIMAASLLAVPARSSCLEISSLKKNNELPFNVRVSLPQGNQTENLQVSHLLMPFRA